MTEEDKLRLKIFQIKAYRFFIKTMKKSERIARKAGLTLGLFLVALSAKGQSLKENTSFGDLIAKVSTVYKNNPKDFLAMLENSAQNDVNAQQNINNTIDLQIDLLVGQLMSARTDSLLTSIARLDATSFKNSEIKRNFKTSIGRNPTVKEMRLYCLATQCAADYRALRAMGLENIIPQDLRNVSAGTKGYADHQAIKPFVHKVKTDSTAIANCIQENGLGIGTYIFYPRAGGSYHAMSVSEFGYLGEDIKLSGANRQRTNVDISTKGWVTSRETLIIDMVGVYTSFIKNYLDGKTLSEQVAFLYHGGADEFIKQLKNACGIKEDNSLIAMVNAGVEKMAAEKPMNDQTANTAFLLALIPLAYKRRSNETMRNLAEIESKLSRMDDLKEAQEYLDKNLDKALINMSTEEKDKFLTRTIFGNSRSGEIDMVSGALLVYAFSKKAKQATENKASALANKKIQDAKWHKVAKQTSEKNGNPKTAKMTKGRIV